MTKEEYQKNESDLLEQKWVLERALSDLRKEYVATNSPIPEGTKVQVFNQFGKPKEVGILLGYEFMYDDIRPIVAKMKKDGTAHKSARIFVWYGDTIEPIE